MKRNTLTTAVLAGLTGVAGMASVANAVNVNPEGLGQVLLYPYYTARGGNDTLVSIVNTSENSKAVKIRFLEGLNSREVLDFNIYMSPYDVWVAGVTATEDGGGKLLVNDTTCTVPYLVGDRDGEQEFLTFAYTGSASDARDPEGIQEDVLDILDTETWNDYLSAEFQQVERTASGYIEVIEMGEVDSEGAIGYHDAIKHSEGVPPGSALVGGEVELDEDHPVCGALIDGWTGGAGSWIEDDENDMLAPAGGLFGSGSIINVQKGTLLSYDALALDNWTTAVTHTDPGDLAPNLNQGTTSSSVFLSGSQSAQQVNWGEPFEAVSATIMQDAIMNEYVTGGGTASNTEWVVTFPTKSFYADKAPEGDALSPPNFSNSIPPFLGYNQFQFGWRRWAPFLGCETVSDSIWDREENEPTVDERGPIVSPRPPEQQAPTFRLCGETNVVRFGDGSPSTTEIFGEPAGLIPSLFPRYTNIDNEALGYDSGWVQFDFDNGQVSRPGTDANTQETVRYAGLPVMGFQATTYTNGTLTDDSGDSVRANYGGTYRHRGTRDVTVTSD
ncbi:hypothetical protein [Wenzhouxiangella sp. EGI_FJ10305]|uniref:hypothetical protein n=1 Tax=Wenzhouxiangella sp. EGI_FJ10305 TaxID=3243768 RepID=UPI0035D9A27A